MTFYEIATLKTVIFGAGKAAPGIEAWVNAPEAKGRLLGAFGTDIGALNEVLLLRGFDSLDDLAAERQRALTSDNPFNCVEHLVDLRPPEFARPVEQAAEKAIAGVVHEQVEPRRLPLHRGDQRLGGAVSRGQIESHGMETRRRRQRLRPARGALKFPGLCL